MRTSTGMAVAAALLASVALAARHPTPTPDVKNSKLELGAFSVSLAVKDIAASRAFYEQLGFSIVMGQQERKWLILRNGTTTIGLFQGMFEKDGLTFNPLLERRGEAARVLRGRARDPAPTQGRRPRADERGRRELHWPGELHAARPRRQSGALRPARAQAGGRAGPMNRR